jgi:hypothetical protein
MEEGRMKKASGGSVAWFKPSGKQPRTKDENENDSNSSDHTEHCLFSAIRYGPLC